MRVYISGPITGTNDFEQRFAAAETKLKAQGFEVFNPSKINLVLPDSATWEDCMKLCEAMLGCCDTIYMLRDWEKSRGAMKEYHLAMAADMIVLRQYEEKEQSDDKEE